MKKRISAKTGCMLALLALPVTNTVVAMDEAYLDELPVYLTVTRLPQNITEMPASITVIDRAMIEAAGVVELTDLFRLVPGFQLGHDHSWDGSRTIVSSHGFSDAFSRRMQVLVDGFSVYKPSTGGPEWHDLPISLDDIERIEVIRGPNASTYGANSVDGVISITTRHTADRQGMKISTTQGERSYRQYGFRYGDEVGNLSFRLSGEYIQDTGMVNDPMQETLNDDKLTRFVNFRADYRMGINDYLTVQLANGGGYRQSGGSIDVENPLRERKMENNHQFISWQRIKDTDSELQVKLSHQKHGIDDYMEIVTPVLGLYGINDLSMSSDRYSMELIHRLRLGEKTRWVWGAELRRDSVAGGSFFDTGNEYEADSKNVHWNLEWRPRQDWLFHLGNMWEDHEFGGKTNSPRVAINHLLGEGQYVRAAAGRAYRMPVFLEEKGDYKIYLNNGMLIDTLYYSQGNLEPEKQDSVELAMGMERHRHAYDLRLFRNHITNSIYVPRNKSETVPGYQIFANGGDMLIKGVELAVRMQPSDNTAFHVSYSHARAEGWIIEEYDPDGIIETKLSDESDSVPKDTLSVLFDGTVSRGKKVGIGYYYVSSMKIMSGADRHTNHHINVIDANYRNEFRIGKTKGMWSIIGRDLNGAYFKGNNNVWRDRQAFFKVDVSF